MGRIQPLPRAGRRPVELGGGLRPAVPGGGGGNDYRRPALPIVLRAEQLGLPLSYFTNVDLDQRRSCWQEHAAMPRSGTTSTGPPAMRACRHPGPGRGHQPRLLRRQHDVLADPPRGPRHGTRRGWSWHRDDAHVRPALARTGRPTPTSRFRDDPVPRPEHDADRDAVRVLPGGRRLRRRLAPAGGASLGTGVGHGDRPEGLVGPEADRVYPDRLPPHPLQVLRTRRTTAVA